MGNPPYADSKSTWRKNIIESDDITWREFYSEKQFKQIKETISYNGEPVCAVDYHPGVLLYNDLNAIDGYLSVFPYEKQLRWHNLIKPEFDRNPEDMQYFDSWGGRRYVYNKDLRYTPTREKYHKPVDLYIDILFITVGEALLAGTPTSTESEPHAGQRYGFLCPVELNFNFRKSPE